MRKKGKTPIDINFNRTSFSNSLLWIYIHRNKRNRKGDNIYSRFIGARCVYAISALLEGNFYVQFRLCKKLSL